MAGRQERVEPLDCAYDLSSLSSEVEAVARGDRSMQQCRRRLTTDERTLCVRRCFRAEGLTYRALASADYRRCPSK
jgi:hypothetical protein